MPKLRILLVQLASNGDCLFVTAIAKQIKEIDYPGSHLSWLVGSKYSSVIANNPYVDEVLQIPLNRIEGILEERNKIYEHIESVGGYEKFDRIFITNQTERNLKNWFGTTRSALFRSYPHKLKVNPRPVIYLTESERINIERFCSENNIGPATFNVLFECSPQTSQSIMNLASAVRIAEDVLKTNDNVKFILSSNQSPHSANPNIIDGSKISFRENAELANHCDLLIGCSSGISWLCTSNWARSIKMIQVVNTLPIASGCSASMKLDFKYFGIDHSDLIELANAQDHIIKECIVAAINGLFESAKNRFDVKFYNNGLANYRFLKESKIKLSEKAYFYLIYYLGGQFLKECYYFIKPAWFAPMIWFRKIKLILVTSHISTS